MFVRPFRIPAAAVLAFAVGTAPLPTQASETVAEAPAAPSCRSGEDLFRGLFYGQGSSAELIEEIADPKALKAAEAKKSQLTVAQAKRLLEAQHAKLVAADRVADAELVAMGIAGLAKREAQDAKVMAGVPAATEDTSSQVVAMVKKRDPQFFVRLAAGLQSGDPVKVDRAIREGWQRNMKMIGLLSGTDAGPAASDPEPGHGVDQDSSVVLWIGIAIVLFIWIALPLTNQSFTGLAHDESVARLTKKLACPAR